MKAVRQARLELSGGSTPDQLKPRPSPPPPLPPAGGGTTMGQDRSNGGWRSTSWFHCVQPCPFQLFVSLTFLGQRTWGMGHMWGPPCKWSESGKESAYGPMLRPPRG